MQLTFKWHIFNVYLLCSQYPQLCGETLNMSFPTIFNWIALQYALNLPFAPDQSNTFWKLPPHLHSSLLPWVFGCQHHPFSSQQDRLTCSSPHMLLDSTAHALSTPVLTFSNKTLAKVCVVWHFMTFCAIKALMSLWAFEPACINFKQFDSTCQWSCFTLVEMNISLAVFFIMEQCWTGVMSLSFQMMIYWVHAAAVNAKQAFFSPSHVSFLLLNQLNWIFSFGTQQCKWCLFTTSVCSWDFVYLSSVTLLSGSGLQWLHPFSGKCYQLTPSFPWLSKVCLS